MLNSEAYLGVEDYLENMSFVNLEYVTEEELRAIASAEFAGEVFLNLLFENQDEDPQYIMDKQIEQWNEFAMNAYERGDDDVGFTFSSAADAGEDIKYCVMCYASSRKQYFYGR